MSSKRTIVLLGVLVLLASGACRFSSMTLLVPATPSPTAVRNVLTPYQPKPTASPQIAIPTQVMPQQAASPTIDAYPLPTLTPMATAVPEYFCCLRFAPGPFGPATTTFAAGTEIIYAVWDYSGLQPGDKIRRIWLQDDLIWISREEEWEWDKYGVSGTVRDLSIFDFEGSGLPAANYRLQLYVNNTLQQEGTFVILPP